MPVRPSSHDDKITVNITLSSLPPTRQGFGTVLILVPLATNSLNGSRVVTYAAASEAVTDEAAGYISATTLARVQAVFAQRASNGRSPDAVKVGYVDIVGLETYADGYDTCAALDSDFYAVCLEPRTDAEILSLAAQVEAVGEHICGVVSRDSGWLTSGVPAALSALAAYERTVVYYHDTATAYVDVAHMASRLMFDPDELSVGWEGTINSVAALTTSLTAAQRLAAVANYANLGLPYGSVDNYVSRGVNAKGRPIYEVLTADWLRARVREDLAELQIEAAARGEKIIVDESGQAKGLAIIEARLEQGEVAGHFVRKQTSLNAPAITDADRTARKLRFTGSGQRATDASLVDFDFTISTDPVVIQA